MAKPKRGSSSGDDSGWTASQVVAHNLTQARELRGMTQTEVAARLTQFTGTPWTATTVAQAEGSVTGNRVRQFTANELVALARTFDLPVLYFFLPPEDTSGALRTPDITGPGLPWEYLLHLVWGHTRNFAEVAERAAPWAHASTVLVPDDDVLERDTNWLARTVNKRERLTPEDMLAVAFNGLARRRMRGSMVPGESLQTMIANLHGLAYALEAFDSYKPGTFFDTEMLREIAAQKERTSVEFEDGAVDPEETTEDEL
ncbi:MAG: hypothetical protein QOE58_678 [Actinomycetota bacterium]|jgi:transcriptional regulator with XRE-family HTH domain|nr:hypothetical protein [Actinomycetota bacterium]